MARFARRRIAMVERISEMKDAYCIIPEGAFYAMLVVSGVYGKKFGSRVINNSVGLCGHPSGRREGGGRSGRALRRGRLRAHLLLALHGGHARGTQPHRRVPQQP